MKLKKIAVDNAKSKDKPYKISDGGGMYFPSLARHFPKLKFTLYKKQYKSGWSITTSIR
jgi:predicted transcriptional regulator